MSTVAFISKTARSHHKTFALMLAISKVAGEHVDFVDAILLSEQDFQNLNDAFFVVEGDELDSWIEDAVEAGVRCCVISLTENAAYIKGRCSSRNYNGVNLSIAFSRKGEHVSKVVYALDKTPIGQLLAEFLRHARPLHH